MCSDVDGYWRVNNGTHGTRVHRLHSLARSRHILLLVDVIPLLFSCLSMSAFVVAQYGNSYRVQAMFSTVFRAHAWFAVRPCRTRIWLAKSSGIAPQSPNVIFRSLSRPFSTLRTEPVATGQSGSDREVDLTKAKDPKGVIYVANFPFETEEQDLRERFEVFGRIARVDIRMSHLHSYFICAS